MSSFKPRSFNPLDKKLVSSPIMGQLEQMIRYTLNGLQQLSQFSGVLKQGLDVNEARVIALTRLLERKGLLVDTELASEMRAVNVETFNEQTTQMEQAQGLTPVTDRPARDGDVVYASMSGKDAAGSNIAELDIVRASFKLGGGEFPFESHFAGMTAGEVKSVETTHGGKPAFITVECVAIREKLEPKAADSQPAETTGENANG